MLHSLKPASGSRSSRKRIARGNAGKGGTTAGRGTKGQQSRTGKGRRLGFEGGQTPLLRRQPKLGGFKSVRGEATEPLNLNVLEAKLEAGKYTIADLRKAGILRTRKPVKLLARGEIKKKFEIEAHSASKTAKEALKKAGGTLIIVKKK
jgi:large subunit ribosomal protein L15